MGRLAAVLGKPFLPWQQQTVDVALEVEPDTGEWAYPIVVLTVPRQSGKTTLLGPVNMHSALTTVDGKHWYTAQTRQDARDNWMDVVKLVQRSPLGPYVKVREAQGSEAMTLDNGSSYRIFSPSKDALHGKANLKVTVDEAWAFSELAGAELEQAILPTFTTTAGQLWIVSTAGTAESRWLKSYVKRGRAAVEAEQRSGLCHLEWGISDDVDPGDLDAVLRAHPGHGHTLKLSALRGAAEAMSPGEFARAYGNRWTQTFDAVISSEIWAALAAPATATPDAGALALAFDVGLFGADGSIAAAWRDAAGMLHVEVIEARPGTSWMVPRLAELIGAWGPLAVRYDAIGPARDVGDKATLAGLPVEAITTPEYATACASFMAAIEDQTMRHVPGAALADAVAAAVQRPMGDAWAWGRRQSASTVAPLVAVTVAAWALDHAPPPSQPFRIL